ncbi:MAG: response regulator [Rhodobacter sp.]|nr:response regulator [Paracoccaceae bacterium]MCC0075387.1 response regulator [Rhodobacter sp.]
MGHDGTGPDLAPGIDGRDGTGVGAGHGATGHGRGLHVLVIEDEPNISEAIRFILRRDGWAVTVLDSGERAMATIQQARPDLVILDVMLPGVSGFDVLRAIRADGVVRDLPVIMLTAKGQAAARDLARDSGASLFMAKPFANAELLAAVRQLAGV